MNKLSLAILRTKRSSGGLLADDSRRLGRSRRLLLLDGGVELGLDVGERVLAQVVDFAHLPGGVALLLSLRSGLVVSVAHETELGQG